MCIHFVKFTWVGVNHFVNFVFTAPPPIKFETNMTPNPLLKYCDMFWGRYALLCLVTSS